MNIEPYFHLIFLTKQHHRDSAERRNSLGDNDASLAMFRVGDQLSIIFVVLFVL
jgi:hypothetical protein